MESKGDSIGNDSEEASESLDPKGKTEPTKNKSVKRSSSKSKKTKKGVRRVKKASGGGKTKKVIKYDPMENFMVPKHEIVDENEKKELENMYGSLDLFPKILATDPVVIKLGAKEGDLIKIHREEGFYYRVVVRG